VLAHAVIVVVVVVGSLTEADTVRGRNCNGETPMCC
jgi:hypothetical protein